MRKWLAMSTIAMLLGGAAPVLSQPPAAREEIKKLQAEIERLHARIQELEAQLKKQEATAKKSDRLPLGPGGFGREMPAEIRERMEKMRAEMGQRGFGPPGGFGRGFDPKEMHEWRERFEHFRMDGEKKKKDDDKKKKDDDKKTRDDDARKPESPRADYGRGPSGRPGAASRTDELLERIMRELEALRQEIRRQR